MKNDAPNRAFLFTTAEITERVSNHQRSIRPPSPVSHDLRARSDLAAEARRVHPGDYHLTRLFERLSAL
jgi:hypothetical protein